MKKQKCNHCGQTFSGAYAGMQCSECGEGVLLEVQPAERPPLTREQEGEVARILSRPLPGAKARRELPATAVRSWAKNTHVVASLFVVVSPFVVVGGLVLQANIGAASSAPLVWGAWLLGLAFGAELLAQLLFIRAALEDRITTRHETTD